MLTLTRARYLLVIVMGFLVIENKWKLDIFRIQITFFWGWIQPVLLANST